MSDIDPKKLKVAELREELKTRGLDTKGNKAQLVKRLEKALKADGGAEVDDLDDSQDARDYDTSHDFTMDEEPEGQQAMPEMRAPPVHIEDDPEPDAEEAEEPEDAQQMEDEQEEESYPEAQQEEAHQEVKQETKPEVKQEAKAEPAAAAVKEADVKEEEPEEEPKEESKEEKVKTEAAEAESEAPEADQKEKASSATQQEGGQRGVKRRHEDNGEGKHHRHERHHRSRRDKSRSPRRKRSGSRSPSRDERRRHHRSQRSRSQSKSPRRKRSRSTSSSRDQKHRNRFDDKPLNIEMENDDWVQLKTVILDKYNSDLNLRIHESGVKANPITVEGFAFMWAGARSTYGVTSGKIGYEVKLLEQLSVSHLPADETSRHVVRVGFSVDSSSLQLGEEKLSYGYGGTAKASTECNFKDYGETFTEGDVIGAYVDFESDPVTISYSKNGQDLGTCFEVPAADLEGKALFPHVLTKNTEFEVNFGQKEEPAFPIREGFTWISTLDEEQRVRGAMPPTKKEECEMIMMCGLPGSGKTTWAGKHAQENPEKKFNVLGTNNIIDKMKVMGLPRKKNYAGRWDMLIDKATKCLNRMLEIAAKKKRNYILDQTNVYPSAQRRKMRPFEGFQRKAVVIVPTDEEFKKRCEQREKEEGKEVPDSAVLEMKANFQLPEEGQLFDKVEYVELAKEEAAKLIDEYRKDAQSKLPPPEKRFNRSGGYFGRDRGRDNRSGGGYNRDRYSSGSYDRNNKNGRGFRRGGYMGYSQQDRNRHDNRNRSYGSSGSGNWGKQGSWGGNQGNWGNQGSWGNQGGWGNQGWGNQGWGNQGWGNQGWNYNQTGNQGWNNQGYNYGWGNNQGWGGYGSSQPASQSYWGNQGSYNYSSQK